MTTVGAGKGTVLFDSFNFESSIVNVSKSGVVSLASDPRVSNGQSGHVRIAVVGHPDITADLEVPSRYDTAFAGHFSGADGNSGMDGFSGIAGSDGTNGSLDANSPSAGGNGTNGSDGADGAAGGDGSPGDTVRVWITLKPGSPLLQVRASSTTRGDTYFLVDPNGGSLSLDANGGAGGRGGSGGKGGRGGSGGFGIPYGSAGRDGLDGHDGRSGSAGEAGRFLVSIDPAARPYLDHFRFTNNRGDGGPAGPAPQVQTEPVAPLW